MSSALSPWLSSARMSRRRLPGVRLKRIAFASFAAYSRPCSREPNHLTQSVSRFFCRAIRHAELMDQIVRASAKLAVIGTAVTPTVYQVPITPTGHPRIVSRNPYNGRTAVVWPLRATVELMAWHFGLGCD